jgi:hypothetical protein
VGVLMILWFVLPLQISGQNTELTLQDTMNFIVNALNSRGTISWTETFETDMLGFSFTMNSSLSDVNADSPACSLKWTSVYTSSEDRLVESYLVNLGIVSDVSVVPYSKYRKLDYQHKFEVSPETYVLLMRTDVPLAGNKELYHKNKLKSKTKLPNESEAPIFK